MIFSQETWQTAGWTMINFLAAGTFVWMVSGLLRIVLKRVSANVRYGVSLATLIMLTILPVIIAGYLIASHPRQWVKVETTNRTKDTNRDLTAKFAKDAKKDYLITEIAEDTEKLVDYHLPTPQMPGLISIQEVLDSCATYLPWLWLVGTPLTFLLLASGLIGAERLRSSSTLLSDGPIYEACLRLRAALDISHGVGIAICERIATPLVVGALRPMILLPPAALNGWTTDELEMVLVHELAHVRRWDNAVNLAQRIVESLLFFHPAVWIVSGWVRRDREDCCDAAVVRHTAKPQAYAELLLALASHQPLVGLAATAMAQHPVASRIRRILKLEDEPMLVTRKGLAIGVSVVLAAMLFAFALPTSDAEETASRERPDVSREAELVGDERAAEEQTTNDIHEDDIVVIRSYFEANNSNSQQRVEYDVPEEYRDQIEGLFDGYRKDPFGPRVVFEWKWLETGKRLSIEAPEQAHNKVFGPVFAHMNQKAKQTTDQTNEEKNLTTEGAESTEKDKVTDRKSVQIRRVYALGENETEIKNWLKAVDGSEIRMLIKDGKEMVVVSATDEGHEKLSEMLQHNRGETSNSSFPTLEEQRAADLAYKLLGVEVEKLSPEELERVKAKGYKGSLRVAIADNLPGKLWTGDLLVGLHVWPTESLEQVTKILSRDDLDQLSPLKFYAIRARPHQSQGIYGPDENDITMVDQVITGRVHVDLDQWRVMRLADSSQGEQTSNDKQSDLLYDGKTFEEWRQQLQSELKPEKRIECLHALVAFSRAGRGDDAADAILAVAGEFDWKKRSGDPLQEQCLTAFYSLNSQVALKAVLKAADSENTQIVQFAELVALNLGKSDNEIREQLKEKFPYLEFASRKEGEGGMGGGAF